MDVHLGESLDSLADFVHVQYEMWCLQMAPEGKKCTNFSIMTLTALIEFRKFMETISLNETA
jgi:hypothetical protein